MRKQFLMFLLAFALMLVGIAGTGEMAEASDEIMVMEDVAYEDLLTEDALIGTSQSQTRGYYLLNGSSVINKQATNKIGAGGITNATMNCRVIVTAIVERKVNGSWAVVTSWSVSKASDMSVMASKILTVGTGYYYRVRCLHYAATDASSSWTNALKM